MAETAMGQMDEPGQATNSVLRPREALRGANKGTGCPLLPGSSFLSEWRSDRGAVAGTTKVGWRSQLLIATE